ncbi:MAG TPA: DASS family sodium-coupled anion symporter [Pyrinomonadaceae bacterium]|jgi:DASS family divalent anion:Na+ symporter|nr:DASS family sodium-coupled anion symporter [Pyrinomonadaceae bacterium]
MADRDAKEEEEAVAAATLNGEGETDEAGRAAVRSRIIKWIVIVASALAIAFAPVPEGIAPQSWRLLAIFAATIIGSILRPAPGGAMVLLGVTALALTGAMSVGDALRGYSDPIVWLVLAAFMISRGMIKTGLGRRIAFLFIRAIGRHSLGLGYALVSTDMLLASVVPSNGARSGGIIFPIAKSLAEAYESEPGATARRLGAFLMVLLYQCDVVVCAMFLTGQASNVLIAKFAQQVTGIELSYSRWALGAIVPGLASLLVVPLVLYRLFPPEIRHTPAAAEFAAEELKRIGPMRWPEKVMLAVFGIVATLWIIGDRLAYLTGGRVGAVHYAVVALFGICVLLLTRVLDWEDVIAERGAWDVFIWYGGLVRMAEALGETGITKRFAETAAGLTYGWTWWAALSALLLVYFYAHYAFASITAHATAMYTPFLVVILASGAPPYLAVLSLAYFSNLDASLTHYGTTPAPIWFGAGYVNQRTWWWLGLVVSLLNISIWMSLGPLWWKMLRWW